MDRLWDLVRWLWDHSTVTNVAAIGGLVLGIYNTIAARLAQRQPSASQPSAEDVFATAFDVSRSGRIPVAFQSHSSSRVNVPQQLGEGKNDVGGMMPCNVDRKGEPNL